MINESFVRLLPSTATAVCQPNNLGNPDAILSPRQLFQKGKERVEELLPGAYQGLLTEVQSQYLHGQNKWTYISDLIHVLDCNKVVFYICLFQQILYFCKNKILVVPSFKLMMQKKITASG